jgi:hypothetical protein
LLIARVCQIELKYALRAAWNSSIPTGVSVIASDSNASSAL